MSDKRVTLALSVETAQAVDHILKLASHGAGDVRDHAVRARDTLRAALSSHRQSERGRERERERVLGLPWAVDPAQSNGYVARVVCADYVIVRVEGTDSLAEKNARARLMASAPRLAAALEELLAAYREHSGSTRSKTAESEARAALIESGWLPEGGGE